MQLVPIKVKKLESFSNDLSVPTYTTEEAAGADIRCCLSPGAEMRIAPGERVLVPTGLSFEIPPGYEIQVRPRSGLSFKTGLMILNAPGTIDSDYRGEIKIIMGNLGPVTEIIKHGDRIAQLVVAPLLQAHFIDVYSAELSSTKRGEGGFGSTGVC
ncbi:MAG: deoxyuridine 5'-triphosphate nucleotidohydrolase [Bdellovibrionales bacterium RIFOXYD12_FULL_39_22]|nr:MAG: deoxyuridine 5'-triphosphate nucleotidohydrolase [Bdellovibrionales bacterium RIFOXYB1_FULL_39_21]OFZ44055.1 MAG: deoxyuridine 5'-triphosphate nucleotidohydrolase [Bdellovibrionales bacterium RIFOXYC12_FULL_39_17]OFZ48543.1 MAG: deoxyuridine 5'-triphosphate nucleotidohydrolase [Bdellovibrionales bacterium RIFOXYC1_FULL_39_130]OFZ76731.1 MAG: deoxyuridine 5'-triphosphate nucleotidohydrolase [Bdellovibrionales bacterium RIFOXYD1_FULL_39_84]OFZ95009.1 MAG: deoxyuridine 5'-triphosphate nucl